MAVNASQISGTVWTIHPSHNLAGPATWRVTLGSGVVKAAGSTTPFEGIAGATYQFAVAAAGSGGSSSGQPGTPSSPTPAPTPEALFLISGKLTLEGISATQLTDAGRLRLKGFIAGMVGNVCGVDSTLYCQAIASSVAGVVATAALAKQAGPFHSAAARPFPFSRHALSSATVQRMRAMS